MHLMILDLCVLCYVLMYESWSKECDARKEFINGIREGCKILLLLLWLLILVCNTNDCIFDKLINFFVNLYFTITLYHDIYITTVNYVMRSTGKLNRISTLLMMFIVDTLILN